AAQKAPGVQLVLSHLNAQKLPQGGRAAVKPPAGRVLSLLQDNVVHYNGQPIAVVVADTFEHAVAAAELVKVRYREEKPELDFERAKGNAYAPKQMPQGEAAAGQRARQRPRLFGPGGGRPQTGQRIALVAVRNGRLVAIRHDVVCHTSFREDFTEPSAMPTRQLYACASVATSHKLAQLNV